MDSKASAVSIGLRAKTARAIAVVLSGPVASPQVLRRAEICLSSPAVPATDQPYHAVMELPWEQAKRAVQKTVAVIERVTTKALVALVRELEGQGFRVCGVGIVGAPDRNLEKIGSAHVRAHAAEGVLFRQVLETVSRRNRLQPLTFVERDLEPLAASEIGRPLPSLRRSVAAWGRSVGPPLACGRESRGDRRLGGAASVRLSSSSGRFLQDASPP